MQTKAERLAMIKAAAEKFNKKQKRNRRVRKSETSFMDKYSELDGENINHYTDASKYAKEYYGETMFETTRFDNDWD
jgi:hypothetical protein